MTLNGTTGIALPTAAAPAFSAYPSANQTITSATYTKIQCNAEEFDTNSNYDNATNYRFTPTVAGYYQVNGSVGLTTQYGTNQALVTIYKNGTKFKTGGGGYVNGIVAYTVSALIYLNGSSDYIELYAYQGSGGSLTISGAIPDTYFQASMVRSA